MSTLRFALVWGGLEAAGRVAVLFLLRAVFGNVMFPNPLLMMLPYSVALGLVSGVLGSWILRRWRKPVRGWVWAILMAGVASDLVLAWAGERILGLLITPTGLTPAPLWLEAGWMVFAGANRGLLQGAAEGIVLWRRSWPSSWRLYLAGRVAVGLLAVTASRGISWLIPDSVPAGLWVEVACSTVIGFVCGAGWAWLLDRCHFKREAEAAPAA